MNTVSIDDFSIFDRLGRGRFGHVFRVQKKDELNPKDYALKVLFKKELLENNIMGQVMKEVEVQSKIRHKYILRLRYVTQDLKRVYLITDLAVFGNLFTYLRRLSKFPEFITGKYIKQLLNALTYLHQRRIVHRDIKAENLLLNESGNLLLSDFGWSTPIDDYGRCTVCGTPDYFPPEMILKQPYTEAVDSWTVGILCFEFMTGNTPFVGMSDEDKFSKIVKADLTFPSIISEGCQSFISVALRADPEKRYSAGELFLHNWTQSKDEDAMSLIEYENSIPKRKLKAGESITDLDDNAFIENITPFGTNNYLSADDQAPLNEQEAL